MSTEVTRRHEFVYVGLNASGDELILCCAWCGKPEVDDIHIQCVHKDCIGPCRFGNKIPKWRP